MQGIELILQLYLDSRVILNISCKESYMCYTVGDCCNILSLLFVMTLQLK